jgi:hypothetical protein
VTIREASPPLHYKRQGKDESNMTDPQNPLQGECPMSVGARRYAAWAGELRTEMVNQTRHHSQHNQRKQTKWASCEDLKPQ